MKIGVLLCGCGNYDGSEIAESILTLLALDRAGAHAVCLAPGIDQMHCVNHLTGEEVEGEIRSVLMESARIGRGRVHALSEYHGGDLQGLIIPGGHGAPKNLVTGFMELGARREVVSEVRNLLDDLTGRRRPIGAVSLGRSVLSVYFGENLGEDDLTLSATEVAVDEERRTLFTPGFLTATRLSEAARGIDTMVETLLRMATSGLAILR